MQLRETPVEVQEEEEEEVFPISIIIKDMVNLKNPIKLTQNTVRSKLNDQQERSSSN